MDDRMLKQSKERLDKLTREINDLTKKQRQVETALADERKRLTEATEQRAKAVSQLVGAAPEQSAKVHSEIDNLDRKITSATRMAESYDRALQGVKAEYDRVLAERNRINQLVGEAETQRAFEQWKLQVAEASRNAEEAFASARLALSGLDMLCARGVEQFKSTAANIAVSTFEALLVREANVEQHGWKIANPTYQPSAIVHIRPLTRG